MNEGHVVQVLAAAGGSQGMGVFIQKRPRNLPTLKSLVESDLISADMATRLAQRIRAGEGVLVVGNPRGIRIRLAGALARLAAETFRTVQVDDGPLWEKLRPLPLKSDSAMAERVEAALAVGMEVFFDPSLSRTTLERTYHSAPGITLIGAVDAPNEHALFAQLGGSQKSAGESIPWPQALLGLATAVVQVGFDPSGFPTVAALRTIDDRGDPQGAVFSPGNPPVGVQGVQRPAPPPPAAASALPTSSLRVAPQPTAASAVDVYAAAQEVAAGPPPLAPPSGWSPGKDDLGPGWELGDVPTDLENDVPIPEGIEALAQDDDDDVDPEGDEDVLNGVEPTAFDGALERARQNAKPSFMPHPPPVHPQTRHLQADPFGGLTLEPPSTGAEERTRSDETEERPSGDNES
jgi:hypothetical protein